jgi:predicted nucleic acid-binding protein
MTACSNTTPFIALCSIGRLDILPAVLGRIHVPRSVVSECAAGGAIRVPPLEEFPWIVVHEDPADTGGFLADLGAGERAAIALAMQLRADWIVIDEALGRTVAEYHGIQVVGTLGLLAKASQQGLIPSFRDSAMAMRAQGIRFSLGLIERIHARLKSVPGRALSDGLEPR